ncbi:Solute carrier family 22 member 1 [Papilio machaon]|uniref:Solute carrier family 22 member 1 n=1 Tax=Papilio machaon TaxID=76193 RepID=A0A194RI60_PAPMA|nr:Solute carrier family 22 member 1 [Papilio machaon]
MRCENHVLLLKRVVILLMKYFRCKDQSINNSDHIQDDCMEWIYDNPNTFMAEFQLANQEWKRTLVGTTHCFGYMVGLLIVGPLSDRLGRKNAIVVTAVLGGVFGVAKSFSPLYWLYIALEFLEAAIGDPGSPAYILNYHTFPLVCLGQGFPNESKGTPGGRYRTPGVDIELKALLFLTLSSSIDLNLIWLSVIVYVSGKLFSWFFFEITYLYTSELFPTHTRNSMHALCSSIGRIGSMTAPQTQLLMAYWSGLPQILFGMTSLLAAGVTLLVPDVSNEALPDTVKQAETMGKTDYKKSEIEKNAMTDVSHL